jgi:hypothetical protein
MEKHGVVEIGINFQSLQPDVLRGIRQTHRLVGCPVCGRPCGKQVECTAGTEVDTSGLEMHGQERPSNLDWGMCHYCSIVWKLFLHNTSSGESSGSPRYWEGHQLYLSGFTNCFCRVPVLRGARGEHDLLIHDTEEENSRIRLGRGYECTAKERS